MATYFDKKKLVDNNSDLYISEYDKSLSVSDLSGVIEAKRDYQKASQEGNEAAMKAANDKANSIRENGGGYSGGSDGSEHNTIAKPYEVRINDKYVSPYSKDKKRVLGLIAEKDEFSYDPESDPIFEIYKNLYTKLGDDAYDRALANGALRMGGVVSTSAQSAAMQAKNKYNTMLTSKIPELYDSAYKKYQSEYERLYKELDLYTKLDESEYKKHRDEISDWEADRDYYYQKDNDAKTRSEEEYEFESDMEYKLNKDNDDKVYREIRDIIEDDQWEKEYNYEVGRDAIEDDQWEKEFNYEVGRDAIEDAQWEKEFKYDASRDAIEDAQWYKKFNYDVSRDEIEDERWEREFEYNEKDDILSHAINLAKSIYGKGGFNISTVKSIINALSDY